MTTHERIYKAAAYVADGASAVADTAPTVASSMRNALNDGTIGLSNVDLATLALYGAGIGGLAGAAGKRDEEHTLASNILRGAGTGAGMAAGAKLGEQVAGSLSNSPYAGLVGLLGGTVLGGLGGNAITRAVV